jgi:hypothetical protein
MTKSSSSEVVEAYQEAEREEVRELARTHTKSAVNCLVRLMKAPKTPAGVKRQCAMDILSQGWGRPDSRADSGGIKPQERGLTINILKLSTGTIETTKSGSDTIEIVADTEVARAIAESVAEVTT